MGNWVGTVSKEVKWLSRGQLGRRPEYSTHLTPWPQLRVFWRVIVLQGVPHPGLWRQLLKFQMQQVFLQVGGLGST